MIGVESLDDPRVAPFRWTADPDRLRAEGLTLVEGRLVVPRLLALSAEPGRWSGAVVSILLSPAAAEQLSRVLAPYRHAATYVAPQSVMDGLVGFNVHRGCLALARRPAVPLVDTVDLGAVERLVVLERVNNPDNVGGIFRSVAALGAELVVLGPACADPLYRKSVRTSMGATLEVPYAVTAAWPGALDTLRARGCEVVALTTNVAATPLPRFTPRQRRVALVAGAEGAGLSDEALAHADRQVTIPMTGRMDSLNVATAVSIALYHVGVSQRP